MTRIEGTPSGVFGIRGGSMGEARRSYRQSDDLYDLIGRMAAHLGTSRTTAVELAVYDLAGRLEADGEAFGGLLEALEAKAREIDDRSARRGGEAMREKWERKKAGWE